MGVIMKKNIGFVILFFSLAFSSFAFAGIYGSLEGRGGTVDAVNSFNKAVTLNGGIVDNNSKTDFGSVGNFNDYQAKMFAEEKNGKVIIRVSVERGNKRLLERFLSGSKNLEMDIAVAIGESMKKDGYQLLPD